MINHQNILGSFKFRGNLTKDVGAKFLRLISGSGFHPSQSVTAVFTAVKELTALKQEAYGKLEMNPGTC